MKKIVYYILVMCPFLLLSSCGGDIEMHKPYGENDGKAPGIVKIDSYEKIPGGVKIKFIAPTDEDLLYIKAKYTLDTGNKMEARASLYSDELLIEGFGNTNTKSLVITAVDRMENEGQSITLDVIPGTAACVTAIEEMESSATFGGLVINTVNPNNNMLYIDISTQDPDGKWYLAKTEYTSVNKVKYALRGFDAVEREFRVQVRDKWENKSEVYSTIITPLYEEKLDLTKFKAFPLPGDMSFIDSWGWGLANAFNGNNRWDEMNLAHGNDFNPEEFPVRFTFDMGQLARISRYTYWQRLMQSGAYLYDNGSMKEWEVWGRADLPDQSGSWDGWIKLMDCESIKPSGWLVGSNSEEDIAHARRGEEFDFPMDAPEVRYIRFNVKSTHTGSGLVVFQQLWFYGTPLN